MMNLGSWMNDILIHWGVDPKWANHIDEIVIAGLLVVVAIGVNYVSQALFVGSLKRLVRHSHTPWVATLLQRKVPHHLIHIIPGVLVYTLLPFAFIKGRVLLTLSQKVSAIYIVFAILLGFNSLLLAFLDLYNQRPSSKDRPIKGLMQILQVLLFFIGGIIIISILINKSPASLFTGLGASAAILMLVFRDTILGFVAGIQLSANDMLRPGDWITVPSANANGIVQEITLNTVKIQNFDNTIATVPPYTLVNSSFQNWRGMVQSGGRRVKKNIVLDLNTIKFCTPELLNRIRQAIPLLSDYQPEAEAIPTNSQLFRVYIERYLSSLPVVNTELDLIISQLQATEYGVPIQIYFFSRNKVWREYERIQSDIFDHLFAMVPQFELKVYQYSD